MARRFGPLLLLIAVTFLAYLPATRCGFIWDDDDYVTKNQTLRSLNGLKRIWLQPGATPQYYPLVHSTYWLEYRVWGLDPRGYHVVNILLHGLNAGLVWLILRRLQVPGALLAAALFAVHPVHAESVVWITERKNTLSGLLYLASAWAYLRFWFGRDNDQYSAASGDEDPPRDRDSVRRWIWYAAALLLFAGALASKTVTVTLPAALLMLVIWRERRLRARQLAPLLPMLAIGIPLAMMTIWMERNVVGSKNVFWDLSAIDRVLIAGRAICLYAGKLIWPVNLTFIYPRWQIDAGQAWQYAYPAAILGLIGTLWLSRPRIGSGALVAVLYFAGTLSPALGFVDVYPMRFSFVADHFQYLASLGPLALLAAAITVASTELMGGRGSLPWHLVAATGLIGLLSLGTWKACGKYKDLESLWSDTVTKNPRAALALTNLGNIRLEQGRTQEALRLQLQAVEMDGSLGPAHNNLAAAFGSIGKFEAARRHARRAIELQPEYASAHINLGRALAALEQYAEAERQLREAIRIAPQSLVARDPLIQLLLKQERLQDAERELHAAIEAIPGVPDLHRLLGSVLQQQGRAAESRMQFQQALQLEAPR